MAVSLSNAGPGDALDEEALTSDMSGGVSILHVEDDRSFAELVAEFLQRERDYFETVTETDPLEGIERVRNEDVDCVVCDYEMPEMNGLEVLREVRDDYPDLPFILFTGKGGEEIASEAISAGVTEYLQKAGGTEQYEVLANRVEQAVARHRAEKQMERGFRAIETAHDGISLLNEDGEFVYVNEPYAEIVGYERDELVGEHFETLYPEDEIDAAYEEIIPAAKDGGWNGTTVCLKRDGERVTVDHSVCYTSEETMICTISETDEPIREELSLRERAMDEAPIGITITDPDSEDNPVIYANEGFVELTGYSKDEIEGRNHRFLQGERTREEPVAEMRRAIDTREPVTVELRNYRKDGELFWNRVTIAPLFDDDGELEQFVGFQEDVSRRRRILEEFSSMGDLLSHDLRNRLRTTRGRLELALEAEDIEHVQAAMDSLDRLEQLVEDLARVLQSGRIVGEVETIDVSRMATSVWEALDEGDEKDELVVADSTAVMGDVDAVRRMMDNLLGNAIEHGGSPTRVRVGPLDEGFYVEDDGPGVPEENREDVFEQGVSTKADDGDSGERGTGMTSVRQVALAHGWRVEVGDAERLDGARFEIRTGNLIDEQL